VRVTLIYHPDAGSNKQTDSGKLVRLLERAGHRVRAQSAKKDGWKEALEWPADLVAVVGGDGTVARVAKAMVGRGIPLAPLPAGTANNISRTLGLVERPWEELTTAWPKARRVKLDIGMTKGPWGERYFVEGVGAGLLASLLSSRKKLKRLNTGAPEKRVESALETLKKRAKDGKAIALEAKLDGKDVSGRYLLFEALCIPYVGPNLFLAPDSQPGDSTFDVVLVTETERNRLMTYLDHWQDNRERLSVLPSHRSKHLHIEWSGFELHIDDEVWPPADEKDAPKSGSIDLGITGSVEVVAPDSKKA
jgi:diacylglycerol kinase family enzyme